MKLMNSLKKTFGLEEEEFEEMDYKDERKEKNEIRKTEIIGENVIRPGAFRRNEDNITELPSFSEDSSKKQSVSIVTPKSFDEALKVSEDFMAGKIIIINTSMMEIRIAQRFLDFVSGTSFAVGGDINRVEDNIYIVTPNDVDVLNAVGKDSAFKNLFSF